MAHHDHVFPVRSVGDRVGEPVILINGSELSGEILYMHVQSFLSLYLVGMNKSRTLLFFPVLNRLYDHHSGFGWIVQRVLASALWLLELTQQKCFTFYETRNVLILIQV